MARATPPLAHAVAAALLALAVAWTYAPALDNGFVWDDWTNVVAQAALRTWDTAGFSHVTRTFVAGHYQPLTWLSYMLQEHLGGREPRSYHLVNIGLHVLNAWLVAVLGAWILARAQPGWSASARACASWLAAALFALHPLRVESVAWATERRDLLSATGFLLALLAYLAGQRVNRAPTLPWRALTTLAFVAGALAKAQIMLPAVLVLLDVWPLRRLRFGAHGTWREWARIALLEKLPLLAPALVVGLLALKAQQVSGALLTWQEHPLPARLAQCAYGLVFYLRATWAGSYSPLHERPFPLAPTTPRFVWAGLILCAVVALLVLWRRRPTSLVVALAWYVLWLLPVLGLFQSGVQLVAERYSYLATLGLGLLAATAVVSWARARGLLARVGIAALVLAQLGAWSQASRAQVGVWRDDTTLWTHVLRCGPSAVAHNNLAVLAAGQGDLSGAWGHARDSLAVVPSYVRPWFTLAALLEREGAVSAPRAAAALPVLERAQGHQPRSFQAAYVVGLAQARAGQEHAATASLALALRLRPDHAGARRALANLSTPRPVQGH